MNTARRDAISAMLTTGAAMGVTGSVSARVPYQKIMGECR